MRSREALFNSLVPESGLSALLASEFGVSRYPVQELAS